jgi:hypothetical protein
MLFMALFLTCDCGTRFEVEDTFAGQNVSCPECHGFLKAPAQARQPMRTSGYALASAISALLLMFTGVGTVLAVLLGLIGLVSIARHRDRLAGAGYAYFGIVWGLLFTGLTLVAYSTGELFGLGEGFRERLRGGQVERGGPLEVVREKEGFAITRPSERWGVAKPELLQELEMDDRLMLVNAGKDSYLDVSVGSIGRQTLTQYKDQVVNSYRDGLEDQLFKGKGGPAFKRGFKLRESRRLKPLGDAAVEEVLLDVRYMGQPMTFLIRVIQEKDSDRVYIARGWSQARRYPQVQPEVEKAMDSFRLLDQDN